MIVVLTAGSRDSIDWLISGRQYAKALPLLTEICREQPRNVEKRQQLAEVLTKVGQKHKAFRVLEELINDFARAGQYAKAIAIVKRMQYIEPGRQDLAMKLAVLVKNQGQQSGRDGDTKSGQKATGQKARTEAPRIKPAKAVDKGRDSGKVSQIEDVLGLTSVEERLLLDPREQKHSRDLVRGSKLLQGFSVEELEALIGRLHLTSLQAGEIVVAEDQPGKSLFLIASGSVRVYVRNKAGAQKQVRILEQGDFFGEISLLKSSRRTATITAATPIELLELDRNAVNALAAQHPKVWEIIEDFCIRRKGSIEEIGARSRS